MPTASRDAERFAAALEDGAAAGPAAGPVGADPETGRLTALAHRLEALPAADITPSPAAKAAALAAFSAGAVEVARHAVLVGAAQGGAQGGVQGASHGTAATAGLAVKATALGHLLLPLGVGATAAAVAVSGVAVAAHRSLPGDPFYSVKRATESVQLHLAGGGASGAKERLAIARTRFGEIRRESELAPSTTRTARIASLVASMDHDVALATGPLAIAGGAALLTLRATLAELRAGLSALPADAIGPAVTRAEVLLGALTTAIATVPAGGLRGTQVLPPVPGLPGLPTGGPSSVPTSLPSGVAPTPGGPTRPTTGPTTAPSAVPTSTGPTGLPSSLPSGVPTPPITVPSLPSSLPSVSPPTISISVPVSVPSLPLPISSLLGGLLGQ